MGVSQWNYFGNLSELGPLRLIMQVGSIRLGCPSERMPGLLHGGLLGQASHLWLLDLRRSGDPEGGGRAPGIAIYYVG